MSQDDPIQELEELLVTQGLAPPTYRMEKVKRTRSADDTWYWVGSLGISVGRRQLGTTGRWKRTSYEAMVDVARVAMELLRAQKWFGCFFLKVERI